MTNSQPLGGTLDERLLEPGWAGELAEDELAYIQGALLADKKLAYVWGFAPSQKTRPLEAIRRAAWTVTRIGGRSTSPWPALEGAERASKWPWEGQTQSYWR